MDRVGLEEFGGTRATDRMRISLAHFGVRQSVRDILGQLQLVCSAASQGDEVLTQRLVFRTLANDPAVDRIAKLRVAWMSALKTAGGCFMPG